MTGDETFVVKAVEVPWSVSPAMSGVELYASDEDLPRLRLRVVPLDRLEEADEVTVEIRFSWPGGWVNVWPGEYPELIDTRALHVVPQPNVPMSEYRRRVSEFYAENGYHPCPHFYRVPQSPWVASLASRHPAMKHYIVEGDGSVWHVVAGGFEWSVVAAEAS